MLNISLSAENVFHIGSWPVTNALLLSFLVLVALAIIAITLKNTLKMVPGMLQNVVEVMLEGALGLMDSVLGSRKESEKYFPLVFTIFIFILISNWSGLIPGVGSVMIGQGANAVPLLRSPASDLNFTLALALIAVTMVNVFAPPSWDCATAFRFFQLFEPDRSFLSAYLSLSQNLLELSRSRSVFSAMCSRARSSLPSWRSSCHISFRSRSCSSRYSSDSSRRSFSGCSL